MAEAPDEKDLHALQVAVNDAAAKAGALWTTLVIFSTYLAITTGTVTHRHLFLETPIKLPILNVDLPLIGYFTVGPILLIIFHLYVLIVLLALTERVSAYETLLAGAARTSIGRALLRQRLDLFIALKILAGAQDQNDGIMKTLLRTIAWLTMAAAPVIVLIQMQLIFLPYHLEWVTWEQRACIIIDVLLILLFWHAVRGKPIRRPLYRCATMSSGIALASIIVVFTSFLATYPGEFQYRNPIRTKLDQLGSIPWKTWKPKSKAPSEILFEGVPDEVTGRPNSLFSNVLILPDQVLIDPDKVSKQPDKVSISLRGRDLRSAVLTRADLRNADFTGANLTKANLDRALMQSAHFSCGSTGRGHPINFENDERMLVRITRASSKEPLRVGPSPSWPDDGCTWLQEALHSTQMQGASLFRARLYGADLTFTQLQGANLELAQMQGATLRGTGLQGADLTGVQMSAADISGAEMQGAVLHTIGLLRMGPYGANFIGARLHNVQLQGASIVEPKFAAAKLEEIHWYRSHGSVSLTNAEVAELDFKDRGYEKDFVKWRDDTLSEISGKKLKADVRKRLDVLDPKVREPVEAITQSSLKGLSGTGDQGLYSKVITILLCFNDQPQFVLRGLIANGRLKAVGAYLSEIIDKLKKSEREEEPIDCPGSKSLSPADFARLDELIKEIEEKDPRRQQTAR